MKIDSALMLIARRSFRENLVFERVCVGCGSFADGSWPGFGVRAVDTGSTFMGL